MGGHIHIRRLLRFGFDNWESRKFTLVRQRQSNETPHWVYCILLSALVLTLGYEKVSTYTHSVGLDVARFDEQGNVRASGCGTSDRTWLHVFYACISVINNNC